MQCRHTVPDWHRYVNPATRAVPILAGCRLLVKEGEAAGDPRSIACGYWGHQRDCPLYDGPGMQVRSSAGVAAPAVPAEVVLSGEAIWPVRAPGSRDGMRLLLIGLGVVSTTLLLWTGLLGLSEFHGNAAPTAYWRVTVVAICVSVATHVLATLRTWGRR